MKFWKKILRENEDIAGVMCLECYHAVEKLLNKHEVTDLENIKDHLFSECMSCSKMLNVDYTVCPHCLEVYPRNFDYRADEGKDCLPCHHGI